MVSNDVLVCPNCKGVLKYYDSVKRIVRTDNGQILWTRINRLVCCDCNATHRQLPQYLLPYRHYEERIINGFLSGALTSDNLAFEDYPCETTVKEWHDARKKHLL